MDPVQGLLAASPDAVLVVDTEGVIQRANRNVRDILGYEPADLEGTTVEALLRPEDREGHVAQREAYLANPEPRPMGEELDLYALGADGSEIPVEISLGPIEWEDELLVVATVSDISHRKRRERKLRESEQRYRRLLASSPAPIVIYDATGQIRYANRTAAEVMAVDAPEELVGVDALDLVHPAERDAARERMTATIEDRTELTRITRKLITPDDEVRHAILSTTPITFEGETAVQVVVNDVTELKEHEAALERKNERLEEFTSIVSHDLRNPLTVAEGHLELATETGDQSHLEAVASAHDRMAELIDDLLTLAREGEGVEALEPVTLETAVEEAWGNVATEGATLAVRSSRTLTADPARLTQLLENLFRNVVEHGGSAVTVTVGVLPEGFFVADDGEGFPTAQVEAVLEPGFSTAASGTGFGLSIVTEIATAHDWEVSLTDSADGGARVELAGVDGA